MSYDPYLPPLGGRPAGGYTADRPLPPLGDLGHVETIVRTLGIVHRSRSAS